MRKMIARLASACGLALTLGGPAVAVPVDLELVIAIDISGSVDATEFALQRDGWAAALEAPAVVDAIQNGSIGSIAVTVVYWQGKPQTIDFSIDPDPVIAALGTQVLPTIQQVVPWTLISDQGQRDGHRERATRDGRAVRLQLRATRRRDVEHHARSRRQR